MSGISERDADLNAYFQSPVFGSVTPLRTKDPVRVGEIEQAALDRCAQVKTAFRATGRVGAFVPGSSFTPEEETAIREERKAYRQAVARSLETSAERHRRERDEATAGKRGLRLPGRLHRSLEPGRCNILHQLSAIFRPRAQLGKTSDFANRDGEKIHKVPPMFLALACERRHTFACFT